MKILFFGKASKEGCHQALEYLKGHFEYVESFMGDRGQTFPEAALSWSGDYVISYLSPWIIPALLLEQVSQAAINFHPGTVDYPGTGCTNMALYHQQKIWSYVSSYE